MRPLARELLSGRDDNPVRLVYGTATDTNTVRLDGESTAVVLPAIAPVESGQRVGVLKSGGDRVIVGPLEFNQTVAGGVTTGTTDADGIVIVTHGLPFTPSGVVGTARSTGHSQGRIDNITATTFRYRAFHPTGVVIDTQPITFQWIAFK